MKSIGILVITLFISFSIFAKEDEPKTFLVIFKSQELKSLNTSLRAIERQFSSEFKTKSYSGNSELTLVIDIPKCDFDACFLGQFLVDLDQGYEVQLQDIAFRVIDMTKQKQSLENHLLEYEANQQKKKTDKRLSQAP